MPTFSEPTWPTILESGDTTYSIFERRAGLPYEITGALLSIVRYVFSDADNIHNPSLKSLIWTSSALTSKILIEPGFSRNIQESLKTPAIFINRKQAQEQPIPAPPESLSISVVAGGVSLNDTTKDTTVVRASHELMIEAAEPFQAELLGNEVYERLIRYRKNMQTDFELASLNIKGLSDVVPVSERPAITYKTAVIMDWSRYYRGTVATEEPI